MNAVLMEYILVKEIVTDCLAPATIGTGQIMLVTDIIYIVPYGERLNNVKIYDRRRN